MAVFANNSRWIHMSTNTLPFYNTFPVLQNKFPTQMSQHASFLEGPMTHWIHEEPAEDVWFLSQKIYKWLKWQDGCNLLLADKTEAGWFYINDRGTDPFNAVIGEYTPEHVHHNYLHTDVYEKSREKRGVGEGASHGEFLPRNQYSRRQ
jgi:hypothetical protein